MHRGERIFDAPNLLPAREDSQLLINAVTGQVPDGSNFASLLQKVFNSLFSGCFVHNSVVHVGYSAFTVNQRR